MIREDLPEDSSQGTDPLATPPAFTPSEHRGGTLATIPMTSAEIDAITAAYVVDERTWLRGIMSPDEFPESDPEAMALGMLAQILMATTSEDALRSFNLDRARTLCGDVPGGKSPVLEFTGARPMKSDYADGSACYVIASAIRLSDGEKISFTTGSRAVQTVLWKHVHEGWMPFKGMLEIRKERTKAGYYPLNLVQGI